MEFTEDSHTWQPVPPWAEFLVRLGFSWPEAESQPRRIALVSMPCESAGAGLIALGALIRDLANPHANDIDGHYDRLLQHADQYLSHCRTCDQHCRPDLKGCGYRGEARGTFQSLQAPHTGYQVSERTDPENRVLAFARRGVTYMPSPRHAANYYISGEPPPRWDNIDGVLAAESYTQVIANCPIHSDNLRQSYSGLCFAGRSRGENASREICASVRFRNAAVEHRLDDLLTVHGWSALNVSRIAFFNALTGALDRNVVTPRLVVADGDVSFLRVAGQNEFHQSDIVGVIHRIMERDRLEELGNKMSALRQWYMPDEDMLCGLPEIPTGMSISILRRRA